jgi:hypothetical protein
MNRKPFTNLRRLAATICALVLMAVALPAAASDQPLPLPEPANQTRDIIVIIIPLTPEPISPVSQQEFNVNGSFQWENTGALKYTLKFKNLRTGEVIRQTTPGICSEYCWMSEASAGLRTSYRDGDVFTWQVIAKMENGTKVNSSKAKAVFNEVDKATLINPAKDAAVTSGYGFAFRWSDSPLAAKFTIIVRDAETGTVALKASGERLDWCELVCVFAPYGERRAALEFDRTYTWLIKTVGMTGEKAKSATSTFKWLAPQAE